MGASRLVIGLVGTCYSSALFLSSVFLGRFADVRGRREVLRVGFLLAAVATLLQAFATDVLQLVFVRILLGLSAGIVPSVLIGYFLYETKGRIGIFASFGALGWGFGSLMAGVFGDSRMIFVFAGGLMIFACLAVWSLPITSEVRHRIPLFPKEVFKQNSAVYVSVLVRHTGANIVWVTYPLFLIEELGADKLWVGVIYTVNAITQFLVMRRLDRIRPATLVGAGIALSILTFLLFSQVGTYYEIIPLQAVLALSWSSLYVGGLRYVNERSSEKSTSTGWLAGMISVAGILGPAAGGYLNDLIDYRMTMVSAAFMCVIALAIFLLFKDRDLEMEKADHGTGQ